MFLVFLRRETSPRETSCWAPRMRRGGQPHKVNKPRPWAAHDGQPRGVEIIKPNLWPTGVGSPAG